MAAVISKWRVFYKPVLSVLHRNQQQVSRLTRLSPACLCSRDFSTVPSQFELPVDKNTVSKCIEDLFKNHSSRENDAMDSLFEKREQIIKNISSLETLNSDSKEDEEFRKLVAEESQQLSDELDDLNIKILHQNYLILHGAHVNDESAILEVAAGVGGQEAMLFAGELFKMYNLLAARKGWQVEVMEMEGSDLGGIKSCVACIRGPAVYKTLRCEGGVHRVQRVPQTEKSGRLHTSTATVVVMPEPGEVDVSIEEKDIRLETKRPSGPGGQNAQKTDSAVRITHIPTGIVCASQEHRSQSANIKVAMKLLKMRLYARNYGKQEADLEATRRQQEGSRMRSEKIRTYNIPQDRVTDHRWGTTVHNLPEIWTGGQPLNDLIETCSVNYEKHLFKEYLLSLKSSNRRNAS